jgi:hypothetical protein
MEDDGDWLGLDDAANQTAATKPPFIAGASFFRHRSVKTGRKLIRPREEIVFHHCGEMLCGEGFGVNGAVACSVAWTILP